MCVREDWLGSVEGKSRMEYVHCASGLSEGRVCGVRVSNAGIRVKWSVVCVRVVQW